jgi:hypothetical protein
MSEAIQSVVFSGTEGRLSFEIFGYERPNASDEYDANWLNTRVLIDVGAFSGSFRASLTTYDFERLYAQLGEAVDRLSGRAEFQSAEGDVSFSVEFFARGHATVSGALKPESSEKDALTFSFETDQSSLSETVQQLGAAMRRLPVRGVA